MSDNKDRADQAYDEMVKGHRIAKRAGRTATELMMELTKSDTSGARAKVLEQYALHMGIGTMFMETLAPLADKMIGDLKELDASESDAKIMTGIWLGMVFSEIEKALANESK